MAETPIPPHPKNAPGDFYVEDDRCIACTAPEHEAPDLMAHEESQGGYHCYFQRQPEAPDEVERAVLACVVSCVGAVRYAGKDPKILERFKELGGEDACDVLAAERPAVGQPGETRAPLTLQEKLLRIRRAAEGRSEFPSESCPHPGLDPELDGGAPMGV